MTGWRASVLMLVALIFAPVTVQAADPRLVPDVSSRAIDIQYSFTGEELLLFGAILYPGQRLPDDRADLAQEIAVQLWRAWPKYDPAKAFSTWMYRVALNVAISHVREQTVRGRHDAVPLPEIAGYRLLREPRGTPFSPSEP